LTGTLGGTVVAGAWDYGGGAFSRSRTVSAGVVRHLVDEVGRFRGGSPVGI